MRIFECENCHSVLIVNEADPRILNGDYYPDEKLDCCICHAYMLRVDGGEKEEEED